MEATIPRTRRLSNVFPLRFHSQTQQRRGTIWFVSIEVPSIGERVGSFCFLTAGERWEWSDEVARMHGYEPGSVVPTTELVLSHKHPDDKPTVAALIDNVIRHGQPFSSRHRIIDTRGHVHLVVVVGDRLFNETAQLIGTSGFYIDVTDSYETDVQSRLSLAVGQIAESRAIIDHAKGILMFLYNISAQGAFDVLRWGSQESNMNSRALSAQFVGDLVSRPMPSP